MQGATATEQFHNARSDTSEAVLIADYSDDVKAIYLSWIRQVRDIMDRCGEDDRIELLVAGEPYFLAWMLQVIAAE